MANNILICIQECTCTSGFSVVVCMFNLFLNLALFASNCIGRKELSHVHIKHRAMTRAMTFGKGLPESEVVY